MYYCFNISLKDISCNKDKKKQSEVPKINKNWGKEAGGMGVNMLPAACVISGALSVHVNIRIIRGSGKSPWKLPVLLP